MPQKFTSPTLFLFKENGDVLQAWKYHQFIWLDSSEFFLFLHSIDQEQLWLFCKCKVIIVEIQKKNQQWAKKNWKIGCINVENLGKYSILGYNM
jgi:hypothetical protein